jgi:hypothetical protein
MAKRYSLEQGGAERLKVSWKPFWNNMTIELDGEIIGTVATQKELKKGQSFQLPDGSTLDVKLARTWVSSELQLLRNGQPLPGSGSDPLTRLKQSYGLIYFIGVFNLVLGLIGFLFQVDILLEMGFGVAVMVMGIIYLVLGFFVQKRSKIALIITLLIYGTDSLLLLLNGFSPGIIVRILFIAWMWQGFGAIKTLKGNTENVIDYSG